MLCPWEGTCLSLGRCFPEPQHQTGVPRSFPSLQRPFLPPGHLLPSLQVQLRGVCGARGWQELPSLRQHRQVFLQTFLMGRSPWRSLGQAW